MKRILITLAAITGIAVLAGATLVKPIPDVKTVKVNERIYALLGPTELPNAHNQGYMVNSTLILGDKGAILIDTGFSDEVGAHIRKSAEKLTKLPITHVINTHHHGDHTLGNAVFPGAEIISSENCKKLVEDTGADWIAIIESSIGRKLPNTKAIPASRTYATQTRTPVEINGVKMEFWVPEAAHTKGDMLVWMPDDKVLIAGDVLVNTTTPNFRDAETKKWVQTLADLQQFPAKTIIPGHGPLMSMKDAQAMHKRMADFYAGVEKLYKAGGSESDVRQQVSLNEWKKLKHFEEQMGGNINKVWLEIEAANF
jgi:glyoxylase-like metal-dependent hydrolase (beta-lactamase superfamily II)